MKKRFISAAGAVGSAITMAITGIANAATSGLLSAPTNLITGTSDVVSLFCTVLVWMFWLLTVLAVAMFLVGGYIYATSNGDTEKVSKATKTLTYAAIAIVVALLAKSVPVIIGTFLGATTAELSACG